MDSWVKERLTAQVLSLAVFFLIAVVVDIFVSDPVTMPFGKLTLWGGVWIPLVAIVFCSTLPTFFTRSRSVIRDLTGAFVGSTMFGIILSIIFWDPTKGQSDIGAGNNSLGLMLSPLLGIIVVIIFGVSTGVIEFLLHRRAYIPKLKQTSHR